MKTAYRFGVVNRVEVFIHWTFLLLIGWLIFINIVSGIASKDIFWSLMLICAAVVSILLHEYGHALAAKSFGIKTSGIILLPLGGVSNNNFLPQTPGQELSIAIAGPMVNFLIAIILLIFIHPYGAYWDDMGNIGVANPVNFIFQVHLINLSIALFNLIPAFPLDGGKILRSLLALRMNIIKATHMASGFGNWIAYGFIFLGIVGLNLIFFLLGFYILLAAGSEEYYLQINSMAGGLKLKDVLMHNWDSLDAESSPLEAVGILMTNNSRYFIVMENGLAVGTINRMEIIKAVAEKKYDCRIKDLMQTNLDYIDGDTQVKNLIEKMADNEDRLYPVMDQSRFAGVVSFQHIMEYLLIHNSNSKKFYGRIKSFAGIL